MFQTARWARGIPGKKIKGEEVLGRVRSLTLAESSENSATPKILLRLTVMGRRQWKDS